MNVVEPIRAPVISIMSLIVGSGWLGLVGWLSLLGLVLLAVTIMVLVGVRRLPSTAANWFYGCAHTQTIFFLLSNGVNGMLMSYCCLCAPTLDWQARCFGEVLVAVVINLVVASALTVCVAGTTKQKPVFICGSALLRAMGTHLNIAHFC